MFSYPEFIDGKKILSEKTSDMLMDIACYLLKKGETRTFLSEEMETAVLLVSGSVTFGWNRETARVSRKGLFTEGPSTLHVCKGV